MRWYMYTGYWPWGLYAVPWPFMAVLGPTHLALVLGNLIHLGVLIAATNSLGRALGGRWAALLVVLCPGVFGPLVRFEPNLAATAWTAARRTRRQQWTCDSAWSGSTAPAWAWV